MPRKIPSHRPAHLAKGSDTWRETAAKRGYDRHWRKFRLWFLQAHPLCRFCESTGLLTPATEVDHIRPLVEGGARLDPDNCRPLCKPCHSSHTNRTTAHTRR
jgi:5-methylcytosine-specific restriction protein A